jgi:hypothetical protein
MPQLLVTANVVPSSPILVTETSDFKRATRRNIPEDVTLNTNHYFQILSHEGEFEINVAVAGQS